MMIYNKNFIMAIMDFSNRIANNFFFAGFYKMLRFITRHLLWRSHPVATIHAIAVMND